MRYPIVLACAAALSFTACTEKSEGTTPAPTSAPSTVATPTPIPPAPAPSASAAAPAPVVEIEITSVGNTMAYDKTKLSVPTGARVHVTLKNNGTQDVMRHNWVLVKPGKEASVALDGLTKAADAGYVAPSADILAFTPLTMPGATADVTFVAPAPGVYPYICTYPGHYMLMKGVLTVTP